MRLFFSLLFLGLPLRAADLVFPKIEDARRVRGELVSADFVHRSGQLRTEKGELIDFTMPPYAIMKFRGSEADLREVPLGTKMDFLFLSHDPRSLITTDDGQPPDAEQQQKFRAFTERRGVAGWITKTEDRFVTVTLFGGDPSWFQAAYGELLVKGKSAVLCVANDELRTWNPPVDGERGGIEEVRKLPTDRFGCSGFEIVVRVPNMLEGFRRGRVVRVFLNGWKQQDQFYGESLMGYGFAKMQDQELVENPAKEYPEQFPFRTDYGNSHLAWYRLKPGQEPPPFAGHLVFGELVNVDADKSSGQFRTDRTGEIVDFALIPEGTVKYLGANAGLSDLPLGTRCRFAMFQDEQGQFTKAGRVSDEFSFLAENFVTYRVESLRLDEGKVHVARQIPEVKNYNGDMERPPDVGRTELRVTPETRVWRSDQQVKLADLAVSDSLLVNLTGHPSHCTDLWIGAETHKAVMEREKAKHPVAKK